MPTGGWACDLRRTLALATSGALAAIGALAGASAAANAPAASVAPMYLTPRADGSVQAARISPGHRTVLTFSVGHNRAPGANGPITATVRLPVDASVIRSYTVLPGTDTQELARWACRPEGPVITCDLLDRQGAAFALPSTTRAHLTLVVIGGAAPAPPAGSLQPIGDATVSVSIATPAGALTAESAVPLDYVLGPQPPRIALLQRMTPSSDRVRPGMRRAFHVRAKNVGGTPAARRGERPALVVRNLLPRVPIRGVRITGDGWRCSTAGRGTCTYRGSLAPGAVTPRIVVSWPVRLDASGLDEAWTASGEAAYGGASITSTPRPAGTTDTELPDQGVMPFTGRMRLREAATAAKLGIRVTAPEGLSVLPGSGGRGMRAHIVNTGMGAAPAVGVRLSAPAGSAARVTTPGWTCSGTGRVTTCRSPRALLPGQQQSLDVRITAPADARAGRGSLVMQPLGRKDVRRGDAASVPVVIHDTGDPQATPQVWFRERGTWRPWTHGGPTRIPAFDPFTYQVRIVNRGGDALPAGATVRVRQPLSGAIRLQAVTSPSGMACTSARAAACAVTTSSPVPPGGTVGVMQVTIRPSRASQRPGIGDARVTVAGQRGDEATPVRIEVIDNPASLIPSQRVTQIPTAGGRGRLVMTVRNEAPAPVGRLTASAAIPPGIVVRRATGSGWECTTRVRALTCEYRAPVPGRGRTAGLSLELEATGGRAARDRVTWRASAYRTDTGRRQSGLRRGPIPVRGPISARAEANPLVLTAHQHARRGSRLASLDGSGSTGNGVSLDYRWRQRCTTPGDAAVFRPCRNAVAPRARILHPTIPATKAVIPKVESRTRFVFEFTVTDGSATRARVVTVTALAPARIGRSTGRRTSGASASAVRQRAEERARSRERARNRGTRRAQQAEARRERAREDARAARRDIRQRPTVSIDGAPVINAQAGTEVDLQAVAAGTWRGRVEYRWQQTSGPAAPVATQGQASNRIRAPAENAVVTYTVTATDARGAQASAQVSVTTHLSGPPAFQSLADRAARGGGFRRDFGDGVTITFPRVTPGGGPPGSFTFSGAAATVGTFRITGVSGVVTPQAITLRSGRMSFPSTWRLAPVAISATNPLAFAFTGDSVRVTGQVVAANAFGLLPLPAGWSGATTLTFAGDSLALEALARGDDTGVVHLSGTFDSSGDYAAQVRADGLVSVGGTPFDLAGSISSQGGRVESSITGALGRAVELAPGVSVTALSATWVPTAQKGAPAITGTGTIAIASGTAEPLSLTARLSYTSRITWDLGITASGGPTWSPIPGLQLSPSDVSGSVGQANGSWAWKLDADVPTWRVSGALTLRNLDIGLSDQCAPGALPCPDATMFLTMSTQAQLTPPTGEGFTASARAVLGLGGTGGFALSASADDIRLAAGVAIDSPSLTVTYGMPGNSIPARIGAPSFAGESENGFAVVVSGGLTVPGLGNFADIAANVTSQGWALGGFDPNGVSLGAGNGSQSSAYFGWSTFATTMTADIPGFGTRQLPITPGSFAVAGGFSVPSWFGTLTGSTPPTVFGTVNFTPSTGWFTADIALGGSFRLPGGGSKMDAVGLAFEIQNNAEGLTMSVTGTVTLGVTGMNGQAQSAPELQMSLGYDVETTNVEASLTFIDQAGWRDAFGVSGLVIDEASFTFMWNLATELPGLKLLASGDLPGSLVGPFQVPGQGIPIVVGAELSDTNPCVEVQVGSSTGTQPVLQMDGGAVTANFFEFIVAPTGCQLAPNVPAIPPGFQLAFDGAVLGTTVDVSAALTLEPTTFKGTVDIGAFGFGGLQFEQTKISVFLDESQGVNDVSFSGGFSIFGNTIDVAGSLDQNGATTTGSLSVSQAGTLSVDGFRLTDMRFGAQVTFGPGVEDLSVSASGQVDILGVDVDVEKFAVTIDNGVVEDVTFDVDASVDIANTANANGNFTMHYSESTGEFDLDAAVVLTTRAGFAIGSKEQPATLDISPQCVAFQGSLEVADVFNAALAGTIVYQDGCADPVTNAQGQQVTGAPGDFSFSASNVGLTIGAFDATGSVSVGDVGGTGYATVATDLKLSPQSSKDEVSIAGSFESNGNFSFTGTGVLDIAGFDLDMQVTASKQGADVNVAGAAGLALGGTTVALSGAFGEDGGAPTTKLSASVTGLNLGGFDVGNATVTLLQTPQEMGLSADIAMSVGAPEATVSANGTVSFVESLAGGAPLFHGSLDGGLSIPALGGLGASLTATFNDCANTDCTQPGPASLTMDGSLSAGGFSFDIDTSVSTSGAFSASADSTGQACSGTADLGVVELNACFGYTISLFVGSNAPYGQLGTSAFANVQERNWSKSGPWWKVWSGWGWSSWRDLDVGIGADVQLDPFKVCVDVLGANLCA